MDPEKVTGLEWIATVMVVGVFVLVLSHAPVGFGGSPGIALSAAAATPTNNTNNNWCGTPAGQGSGGSVDEQCKPGCEYQVNLVGGGTPQVIVIKSPPPNLTDAQKAALPPGQVTYTLSGGQTSVQTCAATGKDANGNPTYASFSSLNGGAGVTYTQNGIQAIGNGISSTWDSIFGGSGSAAPAGSSIPTSNYQFYSSNGSYTIPPGYGFDTPTAPAGYGGGAYAGAPSGAGYVDLSSQTTPAPSSIDTLSPEDQYQYPNVQPISTLQGAGGGPYAGAPGDITSLQPTLSPSQPNSFASNETLQPQPEPGSQLSQNGQTFMANLQGQTVIPPPAPAATQSSGGIGAWLTNNVVNPISNLFGPSSPPAEGYAPTVGAPSTQAPASNQQNQTGFIERAQFQQLYSTGVVNPNLPAPTGPTETICPVGLNASSCHIWEQCTLPGTCN